MRMRATHSMSWLIVLQTMFGLAGVQLSDRSFAADFVLAHPCRDWAWLFFMSSDAVPTLPDLLNNPPSHPRQYAGDTQLANPLQTDVEAAIFGRLKVATANVATMEYGLDGVSFSHKCRYLTSAFQQADFDVVAIQESRARHSETRVDGSFIRLISAAQQGHGGVELWFSKHGFLGFT